MNRFPANIVIIDLEATCKTFGNNEVEESNIIEIAAVRIDKKTFETVDEYSELVLPRDYPLLPEVSAITQISAEMLKNADTFDKVGKRFADWFGDRNKNLLASWGVYYDIPLLRKEFRTFGLNFKKTFVGSALDIRSLAMFWMFVKKVGSRTISVENVLSEMNIEFNFEFHRALNDAKATAEIFKYLIKNT